MRWRDSADEEDDERIPGWNLNLSWKNIIYRKVNNNIPWINTSGSVIVRCRIALWWWAIPSTIPTETTSSLYFLSNAAPSNSKYIRSTQQLGFGTVTVRIRRRMNLIPLCPGNLIKLGFVCATSIQLNFNSASIELNSRWNWRTKNDSREIQREISLDTDQWKSSFNYTFMCPSFSVRVWRF